MWVGGARARQFKGGGATDTEKKGKNLRKAPFQRGNLQKKEEKSADDSSGVGRILCGGQGTSWSCGQEGRVRGWETFLKSGVSKWATKGL